jgi:hypothetical protein
LTIHFLPSCSKSGALNAHPPNVIEGKAVPTAKVCFIQGTIMLPAANRLVTSSPCSEDVLKRIRNQPQERNSVFSG